MHRSLHIGKKLACVAVVAFVGHTMLVVSPVVLGFQQLASFQDALGCKFEPASFGGIGVFGRGSVADAVVERIGRCHDHGVFAQLGELVNTWELARFAAGQIRETFDDLWAGDASTFGLSGHQPAERGWRMVALPVVTEIDTGSLDAPDGEVRRIVAFGHTDPGVFHLIARGM